MVQPLTSFQAPDIVLNVAGEVNLEVVAPVGPPGPPGTSVLHGVGAPAPTVGANGDFYINTDGYLLYGPKQSGAWPNGVSLIGQRGVPGDTGDTGADGRTVLYGLGPPESPTGADGDF